MEDMQFVIKKRQWNKQTCEISTCRYGHMAVKSAHHHSENLQDIQKLKLNKNTEISPPSIQFS